jgi:acyl carrier protein
MSLAAEVNAILSSEFGLDTSELNPADPLFSTGRLDSLSSLKLLMSLESAFGLSISPLDVSLEDIDSVEKIESTITRLRT